MRIIKTFTRFDGMRVKVEASLMYASVKNTEYHYKIEYCEKGKRKFLPVPSGFIADKEVNNTLEELWLKIKPPVLVTPDF